MYRKSGHGGRRSSRSEGMFCNYPYRICMQDRYESYEFCLDHILEDKSAPFKPCNFVSTKTGQKCQKAAPKADRREGYCPAHARKAAQMRHKAALKAKPTDPVRDTLEDLDYYRPNSTKSVPEVPPSLAAQILDYGSESENEGDPLTIEQAWRAATDSDAESVDSEQEDALRYAGVYTAEEAALITKDKLIRLQSLYINQFKRLQHVMKEKRRSYLQALAREREAYGIDFGVITDPKQKRKFREYQAARGFRRRKGNEALLYNKSKQRRIEATPEYQGKQKVPLTLHCCYKPDEEEKCTNSSLPMAKYCKEHILHDPKQVLYKECSKGEGICERPTSLMSQDDSCLLHMGLPEHTPYKAYEPEPQPPPPKPISRPRPPPKVIPLETLLPPVPILPPQLDSQIDQLLQFQPQFLEQQLQQHVYDASRCMGAFAPPDEAKDEKGQRRPRSKGKKLGDGEDDEEDDDEDDEEEEDDGEDEEHVDIQENKNGMNQEASMGDDKREMHVHNQVDSNESQMHSSPPAPTLSSIPDMTSKDTATSLPSSALSSIPSSVSSPAPTRASEDLESTTTEDVDIHDDQGDHEQMEVDIDVEADDDTASENDFQADHDNLTHNVVHTSTEVDPLSQTGSAPNEVDETSPKESDQNDSIPSVVNIQLPTDNVHSEHGPSIEHDNLQTDRTISSAQSELCPSTEHSNMPTEHTTSNVESEVPADITLIEAEQTTTKDVYDVTNNVAYDDVDDVDNVDDVIDNVNDVIDNVDVVDNDDDDVDDGNDDGCVIVVEDDDTSQTTEDAPESEAHMSMDIDT